VGVAVLVTGGDRDLSCRGGVGARPRASVQVEGGHFRFELSHRVSSHSRG